MSVGGQTGSVVEWLKAGRADVVHVHSLEGFGFDLIGAVRRAGIPVVITPHNYYYVCPQVDLLHRESRVCEDYEGGKRCVGCLGAPEPAAEVRSRRVRQSGRRLVGGETTCKMGRRRGGRRVMTWRRGARRRRRGRCAWRTLGAPSTTRGGTRWCGRCGSCRGMSRPGRTSRSGPRGTWSRSGGCCTGSRTGSGSR